MMKRVLKISFLTLLAVAAGGAGVAFWALQHEHPAEPSLAGKLETGKLQHGGRSRSWVAYLPGKRSASPSLVVVLHASMSSGRLAREAFGYDFDTLADHHGFVVAYPNGVEGHWNEARSVGPFAAKRENVDDVGFLRALVEDLAGRYGIDRTRVFFAGISNGGSMVIRLALEAPGVARGFAAVSAAVPAPGNMAATPTNQPVSMLIMNGTDDPLNPWNGGDVALYGVWGNRGPVVSTSASIDYFRTLAGLTREPQVTELADRDATDRSSVRRSVWSEPAKARVALYAINGGGHEAPHPAIRGFRLLGHSNRDISAAQEIWEFFRSIP